MDSETGSVRGMAAGVPFLAVPPDGGARPGAPAVVAWHLMDPLGRRARSRPRSP